MFVLVHLFLFADNTSKMKISFLHNFEFYTIHGDIGNMKI